MRIAQVAPLYESVPPQLYGGTERVVSYLTDELVRSGHDVTLFASGDSHTTATLVPVCDRALRLNEKIRDPIAPHVYQLEQVIRRADEFDIIHFHIAELHFPVIRRVRHVAHLTTLHGRVDLSELQPLFREFMDIPVVSISDAQRLPLPDVDWVGTVHHGLPLDLLPFHPEPGTYLAFLGRISPEKRLDRAVEIANACNCQLRVAAKIDSADREYYERMRHLLDDPLVEFVGEIGEDRKGEFLGGAKALLFPIDWPEPFGLVLIEALACGLPVIAFRGGSVPEILDDGVTGFIVDNMADAIEATRRVDLLKRADCRKAFERRFSVARMAADYVQLYRRLIATTSNLVA